MAERAERADTAQPSFMRALCMGDIEESLISPYPELSSSGKEVLRVLVGPWRIVGGDPALEQLGRGPTLSGVFVRPAPSGTAIAVLNAAGQTVRTLGPGDGLVAATRIGDQQPTWAVTGVDEAGALAAARALSAGALRDRFAAAVVAGRGVVSVP